MAQMRPWPDASRWGRAARTSRAVVSRFALSLTLGAATGKISGAPKNDGTSTFTITVTDSAKRQSSDSQSLSITVSG
ncbi:MAG: Ig domain-containing protein [Acidimicrobiales bacterium]